MDNNIDHHTVEGFGDEWDSFTQNELKQEEWWQLFMRYFGIFPFDSLAKNAEGFDLGCGSGRWAAGVVNNVGLLHCIDPSEKALAVAKHRLGHMSNVRFHQASVDAIPLEDSSQDFGYSLGVLHHVPNTQAAMKDCVRKLKPSAPFLVYLYYAFDNRPRWFKALWRASDFVRHRIASLPFVLRKRVTDAIAATIYYPMARGSLLAQKIGVNVDNWPLSPYRNCSFYTMRTDALDRFGTRLEQRFTQVEIRTMMKNAELENIRFCEKLPYWIACGNRKA